MKPLERFAEYAAAFETFFETDDAAVLEPFFTEDAVYEIFGGPPFAGRHEGREAVFAHLRASLNGFDRLFATRELELLEGPALRDGAVWLRWRASYRSPGAPELVIDGEETARFTGDRIVRLEDVIPLPMSELVERWFGHYAEKLSAGA
ncbi:MAG: nuclear transport factor 2 family protein [Deltaproteobacteria bacterium]|nr:nuclear transport factor 2 family protein [Deltaproteobacteria bacterium]MBW2362621.1 nuclear transport factor 2 family protein [Deltaproteobacteria bacterium]